MFYASWGNSSHHPQYSQNSILGWNLLWPKSTSAGKHSSGKITEGNRWLGVKNWYIVLSSLWTADQRETWLGMIHSPPRKWSKMLCKTLGVDAEKWWVICSMYEWHVDQNVRVQSGSQWCVLPWIIHKKLMWQILGCKIEVGNWISDDTVQRKSMIFFF